MQPDQHSHTPIHILITIFLLLSACGNLSVTERATPPAKALKQTTQETQKATKTTESHTHPPHPEKPKHTQQPHDTATKAAPTHPQSPEDKRANEDERRPSIIESPTEPSQAASPKANRTPSTEDRNNKTADYTKAPQKTEKLEKTEACPSTDDDISYSAIDTELKKQAENTPAGGRMGQTGKGSITGPNGRQGSPATDICANVQTSFQAWTMSEREYQSMKRKLGKNNSYFIKREKSYRRKVLGNSPKVTLKKSKNRIPKNHHKIICLNIWLSNPCGYEYIITVDNQSRTLTEQGQKLFLIINPTQKVGEHKFEVHVKATNKRTQATVKGTLIPILDYTN